MVYVAAPLVLREGDRGRLEGLVRAPSAPAGLVKRARIVLLAADGISNTEIAVMVGASRPTVISWRERYERAGVAGLGDLKRPGRPAQVDEIDVVVATLSDEGRPPEELGVTHWSSRLLAAHLGISFSTVARIWRKWDIQPHRVETFKFSTDPRLEAKIGDVVGLYLDPPLGAVVVSVDEKSQIQALDRTQPMLPVMPGLPERQTHPAECVLIGDSLSDIDGARNAGVLSVGYANKPGKLERFTAAGADAVITSMGELFPDLAERESASD